SSADGGTFSGGTERTGARSVVVRSTAVRHGTLPPAGCGGSGVGMVSVPGLRRLFAESGLGPQRLRGAVLRCRTRGGAPQRTAEPLAQFDQGGGPVVPECGEHDVGGGVRGVVAAQVV